MNETSPSETPEPPAPRRRDADAEPAPGGRRRALLTLLAVGLALALAYFALQSRHDAQIQARLAEERAREAAEADARAQEALRQAREAQQKLAESEQASAIAAAPEVPAGRDEVLLLEVERLVTLAMHDLQLSRQTATALAALELADARLAAANAPRWAGLRRALARDIERLRALPAVDTTGMALKLDQLIAGAGVWPMANAPAAPPPKLALPAAAKKSEPAPAPLPPPPEPGAWQRLRAWIAGEFGDLLRIHEVPAPESLLLGAEQEKLVRAQLKLRLLGARVALLSRNDRLFHADIESAQTLLALYFEARQAAVAAAAATLRQLNAVALAPELPTLADTQSAVRAARGQR